MAEIEADGRSGRMIGDNAYSEVPLQASAPNSLPGEAARDAGAHDAIEGGFKLKGYGGSPASTAPALAAAPVPEPPASPPAPAAAAALADDGDDDGGLMEEAPVTVPVAPRGTAAAWQRMVPHDEEDDGGPAPPVVPELRGRLAPIAEPAVEHDSGLMLSGPAVGSGAAAAALSGLNLHEPPAPAAVAEVADEEPAAPEAAPEPEEEAVEEEEEQQQQVAVAAAAPAAAEAPAQEETEAAAQEPEEAEQKQQQPAPAAEDSHGDEQQHPEGQQRQGGGGAAATAAAAAAANPFAPRRMVNPLGSSKGSLMGMAAPVNPDAEIVRASDAVEEVRSPPIKVSEMSKQLKEHFEHGVPFGGVANGRDEHVAQPLSPRVATSRAGSGAALTQHDLVNTANVALLLQAGEFKLRPGVDVVPYDQLKELRLEDGLDVSRKEEYLSEEEFEKVFGMDKEDFRAMPPWKRINAKKSKGLF